MTSRPIVIRIAIIAFVLGTFTGLLICRYAHPEQWTGWWMESE